MKEENAFQGIYFFLLSFARLKCRLWLIKKNLRVLVVERGREKEIERERDLFLAVKVWQTCTQRSSNISFLTWPYRNFPWISIEGVWFFLTECNLLYEGIFFSIKLYDVAPKRDQYEIIAGHRRQNSYILSFGAKKSPLAIACASFIKYQICLLLPMRPYCRFNSQSA